MEDYVKEQIRNLAINMIGNDYRGTDESLKETLKLKYNISFDDYCTLVWDLMDFAPVMMKSDGSNPSHVLGKTLATERPVFFAIISKPEY